MSQFADTLIHESQMKAMGVTRYRAAQERAAEKERSTTQGAGAHLLVALVPVVAEAIREVTAEKKGAGRRLKVLPLLRQVEPEVAAVIAIRTVFDGLAQARKVTVTAHTVGARIEDEVRFRQFKKEDKIGYKSAMRLVKASQDYRYKHKVLVHAFNANDAVTPWESWGLTARTQLGAKLLDIIIARTSLVEVVKLRGALHLVATQALVDALGERHAELENMNPWFLPTLEEPAEWTGPRGGGYDGFELPLVKDRSQRYLDALPKMPAVYAAVNALQSTPWRVNPDVHAVLSELWEQKYEVAGLPAREEIPAPERPAGLPPKGEELDAVQTELLKAWKAARAAAVTADVRRKSKLVATAKTLQVANILAPHERFHFPHSLDWRGRAYALPLFLSPQGNDLSRGLLEFAEPKALGSEDAAFWFATAGATRFGVDKVSLAARQDWVVEHDEQILAVHDDPLANQWWTEADEPWQFLAWCLEYGAWADTGFDLAFESRLAVGMDGSCNGLQHFSAMLRDEVGGEAVNLRPSAEPQDVYQRVADRVIDRVSAATRERVTAGVTTLLRDPIAMQWAQSGLLDRSIVKRQVMTLPYGATKHGMQQQLMDHLAKVRDASGKDLPLEDPWQAALWLTDVIHSSIGEVVVAARTAQLWLQGAAKLAAEEERIIRWTAPNGFPVEQAYRSARRTMVRTQLMGTVRLRVREELKTLDKRKQVAGISPNFIHSLDAAHMMLTVADLPGLSWAMVHDSFGCHAADAPQLATTLRRTFVEMYEEHDVLAELRSSLAELAGVDAKPPPRKGNLEIREVLDAEFFFA